MPILRPFCEKFGQFTYETPNVVTASLVREYRSQSINQSINQSIVGQYSNTEIVRFVNTSFRKNAMEFHIYTQLHSTWIDRVGVLQNHYYYELR